MSQSKKSAGKAPATRKASAPPNTNAEVPILLVLHPPKSFPSSDDLCKNPPREPLGHADFAAKYGPSAADLERIASWAAKHGLSFVHADWKKKAKLSGAVKLTGSLSRLSKAHNMPALAFVTSGQKQVLAHTARAIPEGIDDLVLWVYGFDTRAVVQQRCAQSMQKGAGPATTERDYSPRQIAKIYDFPHNEGEGQCLGLIELSGTYDSKDVKHYFAKQGLKPKIVNVNLGTPVSYDLSNLEVTLDLELAASVCPAATTVVYNACSKDFSLHDFFDVLATAVFDTKNCPSVLSVSWAFPECVAGVQIDHGVDFVVTKEAQVPFNLLFAKAALLGITICGASGDTGSLIALPNEIMATGAAMLPATFFPAASPLVLGCGGTTLTGVTPRKEVVWNRLGEVVIVNPGSEGAYATVGGASGGGVSYLNAPPPYQKNTRVPDSTIAVWKDGVYAVVERRPGRGVPDVAIDADVNTGYTIYFNGKDGTAGGTSASAPMWAALIARLNKALGRRVGLLQPDLYRLQYEHKDLCNTITEGSNGAYHASKALWNPCTGLGSPNGMRILDALRALPITTSPAASSSAK